MRISLFWKVFGWFWFSMIAVMLALLLTLFAVLSPLDFLPERAHLENRLAAQAERIGRAPRLPRHGRFGRSLFLLDGQGRAVFPAGPLPDEIRDFHRLHGRSGAPVAGTAGDWLLLGPQPVTRNGQELRLYTMRPLPRSPLDRLGELLLDHPLAVLAAVLVSALACLLLAGTLVRPLREIRAGFGGLEAGELQRRITGKVVHRSDEFGELARDFNAMADSLERNVGLQQRLLRHVSHELRTPLTRLGLVSGIIHQKLPEQLAEEHERMEREIRRMDTLLAQALDWSRLDAGMQVEAGEETDLVPMLQEITTEGRIEAAQSGIDVQLETPEHCRVEVRPALLRCAIENLLRNGLRHAPPGSAVRLVLRREAAGIRLDVTDRGPGVPAAELARLHEPFYRAERDRGDGAGSGMGLAITDSIVQLHGGTLRFENLQPGFRAGISLPCARQ